MALQQTCVIYMTLLSYCFASYCQLKPNQECQVGSVCTTGTLVQGEILCSSDMVCCKQSPDVDECAGNTDNCHANAFCTNTPGSFYCTCNSGYSGNGVSSCTDINECLNTNTCGPNGFCRNTLGSFTCTCKTGFQLQGTTCIDIDECSTGAQNCGAGSVCENSVGSYTCPCSTGFQFNGAACVDIDECTTGTSRCDVNAKCSNIPGSYFCTCLPGFTATGFSCADINECTAGTHNCGASSLCINTFGSYTCSCNQGYQWNGVSCADINECLTGAPPCDANAICTNTVGSFYCTCQVGFTWNGILGLCADINECTANTDSCTGSSVCTNTQGSYRCTCETGYRFNGVTCTDIDECASGTHKCGLASACINTVGSYTCICGPGYYGSGSQCMEYACGVVGPLRRVNGGQNAAPCAWPWQLSVRRNLVAPSPPNLITSVHECAGTLLSPYWFLTTPECILYSAKYNAAANPQTEAFVVAGDHNVNIDEGIEQILTIDKIFIHPDYPNVNTYEELTNYFGRFSNTSKQANAFALVKLSTPAQYSDCVKHVCLPAPDENFCEQACAVTGWGYDNKYAYVSTLQEAYMQMFNAHTCKAFDLALLLNTLPAFPEKTICSASSNNVWPCLGDDGGPVSCKEGNKYVLRATYSYPDNCGEKIKGVNFVALGDVSKVVSWIQTTMA